MPDACGVAEVDWPTKLAECRYDSDYLRIMGMVEHIKKCHICLMEWAITYVRLFGSEVFPWYATTAMIFAARAVAQELEAEAELLPA